jgi:hypothetical protein
MLKAGPAGGSHHQRSDLPARAAHQFPEVGPDQPNRLGLPHGNRQREKPGDYQQEKPGPSPVDPFAISLLLHPLILNKQGCGGGASRGGGPLSIAAYASIAGRFELSHGPLGLVVALA